MLTFNVHLSRVFLLAGPGLILPEVAVSLPVLPEQSVPHTPAQISPAMEYVMKIKQRFVDNTDQYQEFIDILNLYKLEPVDEVRFSFFLRLTI